MANTYTQIYLHVVFAVSGRSCVISSAHREELQKYITGIVTRPGAEINRGLLYARSHACVTWAETEHRSVRFDWRYQNRIDQSHQRKALDGLSIFMAGGLRRVFRFPFPFGPCSQLHSHPRNAPSAQV